MTDNLKECEAFEAFDAAVESAKLLGTADAKRALGNYTEQDARFVTAMHQSIAKHRAALAQAQSCVPAGWKLVPVDLDEHDEITDAACKAGNLYRVDFIKAWSAALTATPVKPAQHEPRQVFESPRAKTLMKAFQEGWASCRDSEFVGEEAENDAFNQSSTVCRCVAEDILAASPQPQPVQPTTEAATLAIDALEAAKNGLDWYRGVCPQHVAGDDDEMDQQIEAAIAAIQSAQAKPVQHPHPDDDATESMNETNAVLARRYFGLLKVVEDYEKHGVTCQTFRNFVDAPCAECNSAMPEQAAQPTQAACEQTTKKELPMLSISDEQAEAIASEVYARNPVDGVDAAFKLDWELVRAGVSHAKALSTDDSCQHGNAHIVHDCLRCGAPVCCGKCCADDAANEPNVAGEIAYQLTKKLVIDMPTARAAVDAAIAALPVSQPLTQEQRRALIDAAGDKTDGLNQDDFADEIVRAVERHHGIAAPQPKD